jgi:hypothetical protein
MEGLQTWRDSVGPRRREDDFGLERQLEFLGRRRRWNS